MPPGLQSVALDYDGTLTDGDRPSEEVLALVREHRALGRRVVLVTGRILVELREVFPEVDDEFDAVVAENGAVIANAEGVRDLAPPVDPALAHALAHREVPCRLGRVILACDARHAQVALAEIGRLGLDCQLVRNRAALMVLPGGVTKGTGLLEALGELGVSHHSTVAVGDAENDLPLLRAVEVGVAVANAVEPLKDLADLVLDEPDGAGVARLLRGPVASGEQRVLSRRWELRLGHDTEGNPVRLPARQSILVTGGSGSGKSYLTGLLVEQLVQMRYGVLVIDREGDHVGLAGRRGLVVVGHEESLPAPRQVVTLLRHRFGSVVVDLSLQTAAEQEAYLAELLPRVRDLQLGCGSPHWIVLDEAHASPGRPEEASLTHVPEGAGRLFATYRPQELPSSVRDGLDAVVWLPGGGEGAASAVDAVADLTGVAPAALEQLARPDDGRAVLLRPGGEVAPTPFRVGRRHTAHVRHWHKYTDAQLPEHLHFRFGPDGAEGVAGNVRELHRLLHRASPPVLQAHLTTQDVSGWVAAALRDPGLAAAIADVEQDVRDGRRTLEGARAAVVQAIEGHYLR